MIEAAGFIRRTILVGVTCAALTAGCVKRAETIVVRPDGSVEIRLEYEGDRKDMESGAPALARAPGWEFEEKLTTNDKNEERIARSAKITFEAGRSLPAAYPTDDPEGDELTVRHPTTLVVEQRGSDTYYHFRRIYKARSWAYVKDWERILIEEPLARGGDVSPEEWDPLKKQELAQNIIHFQALKQLAFARRAALSVEPPLAQDDWLQLRRAVMDAVDAVDGRATEQRGECRSDVDHAKMILDHAPRHDPGPGGDERSPRLGDTQRTVLAGVAVESVGGSVKDGEVRCLNRVEELGRVLQRVGSGLVPKGGPRVDLFAGGVGPVGERVVDR